MNKTLLRSSYCVLQQLIKPHMPAARSYKVYQWPYLRELYHRRLKAGPEEPKPRSSQLNWDQDIELYAFNKRISEDISRAGLLQAFTDKSYNQQIQTLASQSLSSQSQVAVSHSNNAQMADSGRKIAEKCIRDFISEQLPKLPEDGVRAICMFLLNEEKLSYIGSRLGIDDLVMADKYPYSDNVISQALLALIDVINDEQGHDSVQAFVQDFVLTQLVGEDIDEIYRLDNAVRTLNQLLGDQGRPEPEYRLIGHLGQETVLSCYHVGVYCDKKLIGKSIGETVSIAKEMAARDVLMTEYGIQDNRTPFNFQKRQSNQVNTQTSATHIQAAQ